MDDHSEHGRANYLAQETPEYLRPRRQKGIDGIRPLGIILAFRGSHPQFRKFWRSVL